MAGKPSFFASLRRRSRRSSSSATKPNGDANTTGKMSVSVNGMITPSSTSAVENASTLTVDSPESHSASPSEVSSSEMNTQPSNGTIRRRSSARPITAATRSSVYSNVRCRSSSYFATLMLTWSLTTEQITVSSTLYLSSGASRPESGPKKTTMGMNL